MNQKMTRIVALILAAVMVLAFAATIVSYI